MVEIEQKQDIAPICPHCETSLTKIFFQEIRAFLGKRFLYFCPHCSKVLGISHRKGFWMG